MITPLLDAVQPRVQAADAVRKSDDTLTVVVTSQGGERMGRSTGVQQHLRVGVDGRLGMAGRSDLDQTALIAAAFDSAREGDPGTLHLPAPAPVPGVATAHPAALSAGPAEVRDLARQLAARLEGAGRTVESWAERSCGEVEAGNTRGVLVSYDASLVGVGATLAVGHPSSPLTIALHHVGVGWPSGADLEALVEGFERRLAPGYAEPPAPAGTVRVCFAPRAVRTLCRPLEHALVAAEIFERRSPLAGRVGEQVLPEVISLVDDPLQPARPGSRPADDDGVVSRRLPLIERGCLVGWVADVATGSRLELPSTGHARRLAFAPPRVGYTNLMLLPGTATRAELLAGEVMLVEDLPLPPGSVLDGRVVGSTPWAFRVVDGEVVGRYPRVTIRGNVYEMLNRLAAVGSEAVWQGAWCAPDLLVNDVTVVWD